MAQSGNDYVESALDLAKQQITLLYLAIILLLGAMGGMGFIFFKMQKNEAQMMSKINILSRKNDQSMKLSQDIEEVKTSVAASLSKTNEQVEKLQAHLEIINNNVLGLKDQMTTLAQNQVMRATKVIPVKKHLKKK